MLNNTYEGILFTLHSGYLILEEIIHGRNMVKVYKENLLSGKGFVSVHRH